MEEICPRKELVSFGNGNKVSKCVNENGREYSSKEIIESWKKCYRELISRNEGEVGLRIPQFGALSAIRAHWATSSTPATVVLPTGTGKSETIFATIISEQIESTLIIVPSNLLREQIFEGASHFGVLPKLGMISEGIIYPTTFLYKAKFQDEQALMEVIKTSNIIISTPGMIKNMNTKIFDQLVNKVKLVVFDEAHHLGAPDWQTVRDKFSGKKILQFTATPFRNDGKKIPGELIFNYGLGLAQDAGFFKRINFYPIQEFDENKSDEEIGRVAIEHLRKDLYEGYNHVILARAKSIKRANYLFEHVYSKYEEFNPVVIHSRIPAVERRNYLKK